jgi:IS5 family transposase
MSKPREIETSYFQYFCGYDHFQWDLPINPSSMTRWRKRIGEKGVEKILAATLILPRELGM